MTRTKFMNLLGVLGWPRIALRGVVLQGGDAWRAARLTPEDRREVLSVLGRRHLLLLGHGRERLRRWRPGPLEGREERRRRVMRELRYFGDEELLPVVAGALDLVPRPVVDQVIDECMFIGVGRSTAAWISGRLPAFRPILLSGAIPDRELGFYVLHEVGHAWSLRHSRPIPTALEIARAQSGES